MNDYSQLIVYMIICLFLALKDSAKINSAYGNGVCEPMTVSQSKLPFSFIKCEKNHHSERNLFMFWAGNVITKRRVQAEYKCTYIFILIKWMHSEIHTSTVEVHSLLWKRMMKLLLWRSGDRGIWCNELKCFMKLSVLFLISHIVNIASIPCEKFWSGRRHSAVQ